MVAKSRMTVLDVRRVNRAQVLQLLFFNGALSRTSLGDSTGLSMASITNVVGELLGEGVLREAGTEEPNGGRPRSRVAINPDHATILGVDVSQSGISIGAFDLAMQELDRSEIDIHPAECSSEESIHLLVEALETLRGRLGAAATPLGVGIGVPGPAVRGEQSFVYAPNVEWQAVPVQQKLQEALALPVFVENRVRTFGQAEMWFGAGRGTRNTVIILLNTGIGAAIFVDGRLYQGATWTAGEWGHTAIVADGRRCLCGGRGCLSAYLGGGALVERWAEANSEVSLPSHYDGPEWLDRLLAAAGEDAAAAELLDESAHLLGISLANVVNFLNPERIVIGGWAGHRLGPELLEKARAAMEKQTFQFFAERTPIVFGELGADASALGASTLVLAEFLERGGQLPTPADAPAAPRRWMPRVRPTAPWRNDDVTLT